MLRAGGASTTGQGRALAAFSGLMRINARLHLLQFNSLQFSKERRMTGAEHIYLAVVIGAFAVFILFVALADRASAEARKRR